MLGVLRGLSVLTCAEVPLLPRRFQFQPAATQRFDRDCDTPASSWRWQILCFADLPANVPSCTAALMWAMALIASMRGIATYLDQEIHRR